jgi:hypothetical protein
MASNLFAQLESRMRRRAMIDLMDELQTEQRKRSGVAFVTVPAVQLPSNLRPQNLPHSILPIVPARLLNVRPQVTQSDWLKSGSDAN